MHLLSLLLLFSRVMSSSFQMRLVRLSLLTVLFLVLLSSSVHTKKSSKEKLTEAQAFFTLTMKMWKDHYEYAQANRYHFPLSDGPTSCPEECRTLAANAKCEPACDTAGCLWDLGDCSFPPECPNNPTECPHDEVCRWECEIGGCETSCEFKKGEHRQFVLVDAPGLNPYEFWSKFEHIEHSLRRKLHYRVSLQAYPDGPLLWGFETGSHALRRLRYTDNVNQTLEIGDRDSFINRTVCLLSVDAETVMTLSDQSEWNILRSLGTRSRKAKITPIVMAQEDFLQSDEVFADIPRKAQREERKERNRKAKEANEEESMLEFN